MPRPKIGCWVPKGDSNRPEPCAVWPSSIERFRACDFVLYGPHTPQPNGEVSLSEQEEEELRLLVAMGLEVRYTLHWVRLGGV